MIFFFDSNGNLIAGTPENVSQGSNKASRVWFLMPTAPTNIVNVAFTLPNGQYAKKRIMTNATKGIGITNGTQSFVSSDNQVVNAWYYDLKKDVTSIAGEISATFFVTTPDSLNDEGEEIVAISPKILIMEGTPSVNLPPTIKEYEEIVQWLANFNTNVQNQIDSINERITTLHNNAFVIVNELPTASQETLGKIYLIPQILPNKNSVYDEFITISDTDTYSWEKIGSTEINLENLSYDNLLNKPILNVDLNTAVLDAQNYYRHTGESKEYIQGEIYYYDGTTLKSINGKGGTTVTVNGEAVETFNADTKVGFTDFASTEKAGVGKVANWAGVQMQGETFAIYPASDIDITNKTAGYHPITPPKLDLAVKVGVTTNTLTLTDGEKASACDWLGALLKGTGTSVVLENGTTIQWHYGTTGNTLIRRLGNGSAQVKMADAPVDNDIANVGFVNQAVANAGGGATVYRHNVTLRGYEYNGEDSTSTEQYEIQISIMSSKSTALTLADVQNYCEDFRQPAYINGSFIGTYGSLLASPAMPWTDALSFEYSRQSDVMETIWGRSISLQHCSVLNDNVKQI